MPKMMFKFVIIVNWFLKSIYSHTRLKLHYIPQEKYANTTKKLIGLLSDFSKPFIVHTDASQEGLGAALYQVQDGETRIISLASRTLTPSERNYFMHSGKLEFLALKWAVTEKFHDYLINGP